MIRKFIKLLALSCIFFISTTVLLVVIFRFIPVPATSFIIQNRISNFIANDEKIVYHEWIPMENISNNVKAAVIAAEDQKFTDHWGFDFTEIQKAYDSYQKGRRVRGASTITQQTAKNLFLWKDKSLVRKGLEVYFTILLELFWSKERILEVYLNTAEFSENIYGIYSASKILFKKEPRNLTKTESSLLAAVLPNPKRYKAQFPSIYVKRRASWIRGQMNQLGNSIIEKL